MVDGNTNGITRINQSTMTSGGNTASGSASGISTNIAIYGQGQEQQQQQQQQQQEQHPLYLLDSPQIHNQILMLHKVDLMDILHHVVKNLMVHNQQQWQLIHYLIK